MYLPNSIRIKLVFKMYCSHDKNNAPAYLHGFDLEADVVPLLGRFVRQILRLHGVSDL